MPPEVRAVLDRINEAVMGEMASVIAMALMAAYTDVLLQSCTDYEQYMRQVRSVERVLELNGRMHFKRGH